MEWRWRAVWAERSDVRLGKLSDVMSDVVGVMDVDKWKGFLMRTDLRALLACLGRAWHCGIAAAEWDAERSA